MVYCACNRPVSYTHLDVYKRQEQSALKYLPKRFEIRNGKILSSIRNLWSKISNSPIRKYRRCAFRIAFEALHYTIFLYVNEWSNNRSSTYCFYAFRFYSSRKLRLLNITRRCLELIFNWILFLEFLLTITIPLHSLHYTNTKHNLTDNKLEGVTNTN